MVTAVREAGIEPMLGTLPPIQSERYFNFLSRGELNAESILRWLDDKNHIYRYHERYSALVSQITRKCGCRLLTCVPIFWRCGTLRTCSVPMVSIPMPRGRSLWARRPSMLWHEGNQRCIFGEGDRHQTCLPPSPVSFCAAPSPMALARWLNCPQQVKNKLPFEQKSREIIDELDKICYNGKEIR